MTNFSNDTINFDVLKKRAFNYRWAEVEEGIIPLTAADSDFPAPPEVAQALTEYIRDGYFPYTPKTGMPELKESIARALLQRKGEKVLPNRILPIDSAARGMYVIAKTVLQPGDEAVIFDPVDFLFKQSVLAAGGVTVLFPARVKEGRFDLTALESYITPKTKMLGICNPHNPLGILFTKQDLQEILRVANKYGLFIMNDEIWSDIVYPEQEFVSIVGLEGSDRVLSVYGFSKSFAIAGLRAGCVYCDDDDLFERMIGNSDVLTTAGGITSLSQVAAMACMDHCYYWVDDFVKHLRNNRDYALERMDKMPGIVCSKPQATFLLFPDISGTGLSSVEFTDYLKKEVGLALVPGSDEFFGPGSAGHVRICFSTSREVLAEGLNRLEKGLKQLLK